MPALTTIVLRHLYQPGYPYPNGQAPEQVKFKFLYVVCRSEGRLAGRQVERLAGKQADMEKVVILPRSRFVNN